MSNGGALFNCLIIALLSASTVLAQEIETAQSSPGNQQTQAPQTPPPYLKEFLRDERDLWSSLVKKDTYTSHGKKKYGIPFVLLSGTLIATDSRTIEFLPNTCLLYT